MTKSLLTLMLAALLDTGQSADLKWQALCGQDQDQGQLYIDADIVDTIQEEEELLVIVSNKERDVIVKCVTKGEGVEQGMTRANATKIWEKQDTKFWKAEQKIQCGGCEVTLVDVKEGAGYHSQCSSSMVSTQGSGGILCVVTDWLETASQVTVQTVHMYCH